MLGSYQSTVRKATSGSLLPGLAHSQPTKRSLATRLAFDDSCLEDERGSAAKVSRLGSDPFSSALGSRRFPSANSGVLGQVQEENEALKKQLKEARAEVAGAVAGRASAEDRAGREELELGRQKLERKQEREKLKREAKEDRDKVDGLKSRIKKLEQQGKEEQEDGSRTRRMSLDKTHDLEVKVRRLREEKAKVEEDLSKASVEVSRRPAISLLEWQQEVQRYRRRIAELEQGEEQAAGLRTLQEGQQKAGKEAVQEMARLREELSRSQVRSQRLEGELRANQESVQVRQVMKDKLERFGELERENRSLGSRNQLLVQTAANSELLQEQVTGQRVQLARMEERVKELDTLRGELGVAHERLREWAGVVREWLGDEERQEMGGREVGAARAREVVRRWQEREVVLVERVAVLEGREREAMARRTEQEERAAKAEGEVVRIKGEQEEQAKLLKRLQRKLLLVTKERDSYKGVLDSYEKEITLSGQEMDKERFLALEKTLEEYRAMVEMLEEKGPRAKEDERLQELEGKCAALEHQLEGRAIRGEYDPADTKVLHFTNNPTVQAVVRREQEVAEVARERDGLRARVHLLEEGQSQDLTILVGHKMEEEGGEQVKNLKEQLESAEIKKQRLMEAFKKTSNDFREVVYSLTGYRIDVLADHKYRLLPLYAESQGDSLLFQKTPGGEVQMLESEYSLELGDLMEVHLERQNSIPMFLAGVMMALWRNQNPEFEEEEEQQENDEDDDEHEEQEDESEEEAGDVSDAGSEVICIDD